MGKLNARAKLEIEAIDEILMMEDAPSAEWSLGAIRYLLGLIDGLVSQPNRGRAKLKECASGTHVRDSIAWYATGASVCVKCGLPLWTDAEITGIKRRAHERGVQLGWFDDNQGDDNG